MNLLHITKQGEDPIIENLDKRILRRLLRKYLKFGYVFFILTVICINFSYAGETDFEKRMVNAIYYAEGGENTNYPYGIKSIKTNNPREACRQTIVNNLFRYLELKGETEEFIIFLSLKYAPLNAKDDPRRLNVNWYKNVSQIYHGPKHASMNSND